MGNTRRSLAICFVTIWPFLIKSNSKNHIRTDMENAMTINIGIK